MNEAEYRDSEARLWQLVGPRPDEKMITLASTDTKVQFGVGDSSLKRRTGQDVARGAAAGVIATALFMIVHAYAILPIWEMTVPMMIAGAVCGVCIAWSYVRASDERTAARWFAFNGAYLLTLVALGVVSLLKLEPSWTFAELNTDNPPIGELLAQATPLMIGFTVIGAIPIWLTFTRRWSALPPILLTEAVLVLLLGHNVAIIGLVDLTAEGWSFVGLMFALVIFLGTAYAAIYAVLVHIGKDLRS